MIHGLKPDGEATDAQRDAFQKVVTPTFEKMLDASEQWDKALTALLPTLSDAARVEVVKLRSAFRETFSPSELPDHPWVLPEHLDYDALTTIGNLIHSEATHGQLTGGADDANGGGGDEKHAEGYTVAALREMTGLGNTALNKYAKMAGVATPSRGQKNFRYSLADARAVLEAIIAEATEQSVLKRCRAALAILPKIPQ
jgi:hypothetical protein